MTKPGYSTLTRKYWVTEYNHLDAVRGQYDLPEKVRIHDVTLREAEQAPHVVLRRDEKLRLYEALDDLGVYSVEIFPIVSNEDRETARDLVRMRRKTKIFFLCRWEEKEVDFALEAGADGVIVEGPGVPWLGKLLLDLSADELASKMLRAAAHAKKNGLFTTVMPWDTLRAPLDFLESIYKRAVYEAGVDHVTVADTFGFGLPAATSHLVKKLKEWVPGTPIEWHAHNDFGLATSVMVSAVCAGASVVHTSMNSLGERAGNAATEEVALCLELLLGVETGVRLDRIHATSKLVAELVKTPVAPNKPVVGSNEFTFESGQVAYLIEKMNTTERPFQAYLPEVIGRKGYEIVLGKMSGSGVVASRLEALGIPATKAQVSEILERVKGEALLRKWSISDEVFEGIARSVVRPV
ncbi:MAG: hypothetical protein HY900_19185 [Deltaproteobacteria bacterium]|nr:hypothetical protein [Deltaproteobacteria bacterium]